MQNSALKIFNTLTRKKEVFEPVNPPFVGMYVCGPTVYNDVHLGNCRTFISFDIVYRYLLHLGYKVRYVRNITDVGHLENEEEMTGEDRIGKMARLEKLEPMEIVQRYTNGFHDVMHKFNALPPSIEPTATGHIVEQINMVQAILDNGYAYESNGSVYFDTLKYAKNHKEFGRLSGKILDDLQVETRELKGQSEKRHPADFAIWMKAQPQHIMRWNSPWSDGFPGWHLECSVMSTRYLGEKFDIHGGGMDLQFPHHENEIAQNIGACGHAPVNYWMHTNMLTINGTKMSKSLGNSVLPEEMFTGDNEILAKAYDPMVVRFFMLQTHYSSTLDFSDTALQAAEKGFRRLMEGYKTLQNLKFKQGNLDEAENQAINEECDACYAHMNDDFSTPQALAALFGLVTRINTFKDKGGVVSTISQETFDRLGKVFHDFIEDIFGLKDEEGADEEVVDGLMQLIIEIRQESRAKKDWGTSDKIRDTLKELKIQLKDGKEGTSWTVD